MYEYIKILFELKLTLVVARKFFQKIYYSKKKILKNLVHINIFAVDLDYY